jgi:hypothetical protein
MYLWYLPSPCSQKESGLFKTGEIVSTLIRVGLDSTLLPKTLSIEKLKLSLLSLIIRWQPTHIQELVHMKIALINIS